MYRVKEYNSAYDFAFGKGKGWIYVSNHLHYEMARDFAFAHTTKTGLTTEVCYVGSEFLIQ